MLKWISGIMTMTWDWSSGPSSWGSLLSRVCSFFWRELFSLAKLRFWSDTPGFLLLERWLDRGQNQRGQKLQCTRLWQRSIDLNCYLLRLRSASSDCGAVRASMTLWFLGLSHTRSLLLQKNTAAWIQSIAQKEHHSTHAFIFVIILASSILQLLTGKNITCVVGRFASILSSLSHIIHFLLFTIRCLLVLITWILQSQQPKVTHKPLSCSASSDGKLAYLRLHPIKITGIFLSIFILITSFLLFIPPSIFLLLKSTYL